MYIDGCRHTFSELVQRKLPGYLADVREAIATPLPMKVVIEGKRAALQHLNREHDFQGCYVLIKDGEPFYVGISRKVVGRLTQHVKRRCHFSASLAYRMACNGKKLGMSRAEAMKNRKFILAFDECQNQLKQMDAATVEIPNDLELSLFEIYAAMELKTHLWNSFRTH